jgi:UDP-glucose 4-epimerase
MIASLKQKKLHDVFNVGSREKHTVDRIAQLVSETLNAKPEIHYSGGERGWSGDVKTMLLDTKKLESIGWKPELSFEQGVNQYISWLKDRPSS